MDMLVQRFVAGDVKRIFVNPALGCRSSCSYCYLGDEGFSLGSKPELCATGSKIIELVENSGMFEEGRDGSIISIGCFSECWDTENIEVTKEIILHFITKGNPIQLATKRCVRPEQVQGIVPLIQWNGQLGIFVSTASVSQWKKYEAGTTNPNLRFRYIDNISNWGIVSYIYIKPVIEGVTIKDVNFYVDIAKEKKCDVVVGSIFNNDSASGKLSPIPSVSGLYVNSSRDEEEIVKSFEGVSRVFRSSVDAVEFWRITNE